MNNGFASWYDNRGDLCVAAGVVMQPKNGVVIPVGAGGGFTETEPGGNIPGLTRVTSAAGANFVGGSGRNLVSGGGVAALQGWFTPTVPDTFVAAEFTLSKTGASAATISDAGGVVAELTTGGTAPIGSYVATTHGRDSYNGGAAFTQDLTGEETWPGSLPDIRVSISAGTAMGGIYTAMDAANYVSAVDADWTLVIDPSGSAEIRYDGTVVAIRPDGLGYDATGRFVAVEAAYFYNPLAALEDDALGTATANPFGVLTLVYSWPATPDLDTTTRFLNDAVGYPLDGSETAAVYTTWSGDDTGPSGSETVTIDLAQAWEDGAISTVAEVLCHADWYPSAGGSGLATLEVDYTVGSFSTSLSIAPGDVTPASSRVATLRITDAGVVTNSVGVWQAHVQVLGRLPRPGIGYLKLTETSGVLTAAEGPFFATVLPTSAGSVYYVPLAKSDGAKVDQFHTGALMWA